MNLTHLSDYPTAIRQFEKYLEDFGDSARADDALWHIAQAYRLMGEPQKQKATLERLEHTFPESRYTRRLRDAKTDE